MKIKYAVILAMVMGSVSAFAIPALQVDIGGGTYDSGTETTVAASDSFDLFALLIPDDAARNVKNPLSGTYRVSAALFSDLGDIDELPLPTLGSFVFNGTEYDVAADMAWGTPPVEDPGKDLQTHGVFETYFKEFNVAFSGAPQCLPYNVQEQIGDPSAFPGSQMYYRSFGVDVSSLADHYGLHFDLYQVVTRTDSYGNTKTDRTTFAPFSHDAESGTGRTPPPPDRVPDGGSTLALLGLALAGMGSFVRRPRG